MIKLKKQRSTGTARDIDKGHRRGIHGTGKNDPGPASADREPGQASYSARAVPFGRISHAKRAREEYDPREQRERQERTRPADQLAVQTIF